MNGNGKVYVQLRDLEKALNADVVKKSRARGTSPPWLKSHAGQLEDPEYVSLTLTERGFLHDLRLLALRRGNKILVDEGYLRGQLRLTPRTQCVPKVSRLRELGFLEPYNPATNEAANKLIPSQPSVDPGESHSGLEVEVELEDPPLPPLNDGEGRITGRALPPLDDEPRRPRQPRERPPQPKTPYEQVVTLLENLGPNAYEQGAMNSELDHRGITDPEQRAELHALAERLRTPLVPAAVTEAA